MPKPLLTLFLLSCLSAGGTAAEDNSTFPGVEKLMTKEEFTAAGLHVLTEQEIDALNQWLIRYTARDSQVLAKTNEEVKEADRQQETLSTIVSPFKGWSGKSVFRLENGQVWRQRRAGNYHYAGSDTRVSITKNFLGFYQMTLLDTGKKVQVSRVR